LEQKMFGKYRRLLALPVLAFASQAAAAQSCPMPYDKFEAAVPHLDLDSCPALVGESNVFCRSSVANDEIHVFVFDKDGERCLKSVHSFGEERYKLTLK
jgi:hypothetical protein